MHIVIDLTSLNDNFTGIERFTLNISKEMLNQDIESKYTLIFKNSVHKAFEEFRLKENISFKVINGKNKLIFNQVALMRCLYKLKADKYIFLAFPSPILFRRNGIFNTIHDLTAWDYPHTMKKLSKIYFKRSIKNSIKVSQYILTVSKFSQKRINEQFCINNSVIIYNGVSDVFLSFNDMHSLKKGYLNEKYNIPDDYIMCLCTLEPRKNIELLIKAFVELKIEKRINCKLVLVGRNGWKVEKLLSEISEKYNDDIIITGFVEDEELPYIYKGAKCFVFPSLYEGFGIPVLEAMSIGIPVICSDTSSLPEVVGESGILFGNNNKDDLKNKIIEFLNKDQKTIQEMTLAGIERSKKFNWITEGKKLLQLLKYN
jgi:glycosyltransferase involved in cell wall biosynthesis